MLTATLFTTLLKQHLSRPFDSTVLSFQSDNLELIKRQQAHLSYTHPYPNTTLTAEFDLTEMIHVLHRDNNLPSKFCHVKGHQDRHKAYTDLDLCAHLNVEADHLAAAYYDHPNAHFDDRVFPIPSCPAQLFIAGVDTTKKESQGCITFTNPKATKDKPGTQNSEKQKQAVGWLPSKNPKATEDKQGPRARLCRT